MVNRRKKGKQLSEKHYTKLQIDHHELRNTKKAGIKSSIPEIDTVPAPLVLPLINTNIKQIVFDTNIRTQI